MKIYFISRFPYNPNNYSIYLTDAVDNESRYFLNKWKIRN